MEKVNSYLEFVLNRAKGFHQTGADFQRNFVLSHPQYKRDSVVSSEISHDLVAEVLELAVVQEKRAKYYGLKK